MAMSERPDPQQLSGTGWPDEPDAPACQTNQREAAGHGVDLREVRDAEAERLVATPGLGETGLRACVAGSLVGLLAVALLGISLRDGSVPGIDRWLHGEVVRHRGGDLLAVARGITEGGSTRVAWPLIVIAAVTFPRTRGRLAWSVSLGIGALAGTAIAVRFGTSILVHRVRPPDLDWAMDAEGYAFPSGHTNAATIAAGFLAWAVTRHVADRRGRFAVWVLAVGYAALVGWSRVWLGVHWPLDVLGGWLLGSAWLAGLAAVVAVVSRRLPARRDGVRRPRRPD